MCSCMQTRMLSDSVVSHHAYRGRNPIRRTASPPLSRSESAASTGEGLGVGGAGQVIKEEDEEGGEHEQNDVATWSEGDSRQWRGGKAAMRRTMTIQNSEKVRVIERGREMDRLIHTHIYA